MNTFLTVYFGSILIAMLLVPVVSQLAKRCNLIDPPGPRKIHRSPVPRIGGVVFVVATLALVIPVFFLNNNIGKSFRSEQTQFITLLVGAVFLFIVGLIDDIRPLRGRDKLLCVVAAALALCYSGARINTVSVGDWFEIEMGWMSWPFTVLWIITVTTCINIIDGLDGLAAGVGIIVCGTMVLMSLWLRQVAMAVLMLGLLGSLTGFIFFNFYPARIFMGDGGSMFLGFMIGAAAIVCNMKSATLAGLALPFLVLGIPILDISVAVLRRSLIERRSIFAADRNHLHHRLMELGLHQRTVVIVICAVTVINAGIGLIMLTAAGSRSIWLMFVGLFVLLLMFSFLYFRRIHQVIRILKHNMAICRAARKERHHFENIILKMREAGTFGDWWQTVCFMAEQMRFQSIDLRDKGNGNSERTSAWDAPAGTSGANGTVQFILPVRGNGTDKWEMRASIQIDNHLESGGRRAMLLARLMDEFPPPAEQTES